MESLGVFFGPQNTALPFRPENFLAYDSFDNTPNNGNRRKSWSPHAGDYNAGDPTWASGLGFEIIGGKLSSVSPLSAFVSVISLRTTL